MGIVYKAQDPAINRTIAIKSIRLQELSDETERERLRERLFREAQSAGILSHPGIVTIYDIFEENGLAYIFMEFVNGPPLENMLRAEQTVDKDTLLSILRQTASALDYAHRKGIIHRDIKPANIMIHEDGTAKVTDFGVAKIASQQMTAAGTLMGTPTYMSPEQIEGKTIDGRSDLFSLAVIAYEALTGEKPFMAEYIPTLLFKIVREDPPQPSRLNPTLAPEVDTVMNRAMAKLPDQRFANCADFIEALAEALNSIPSWTPLPRGASLQISTVGSQDSHGETQDEHLIETVAAPLNETIAATVAIPHQTPVPPPPPAAAPKPDFVPAYATRPVEPESHAVRNFMLAAAVVVLAGGAYIVYQQKLQKPVAATETPTPVATAPPSSDPAATAVPSPAPPSPTVSANAAPPPTKTAAQAAPTEGEFELTTTPAGANALFDGRLEPECKTPCTVTLPTGRHTFVITAAGYREAQRILDIPHDTGMIVNLEKMVGTLNLITTPPGLIVVLDGQEQPGKTPSVFQLSPGAHKISLLRGSEHHDFSIDIRDGTTTTRSVEWQ
jgi:serine/threonine protein kinase